MKIKRMKISSIDVSRMCPPGKEKFDTYSMYYDNVHHNNAKLNAANPIVINSKNEIIDGYITFLLVSQSQQKTINCIQVEKDETLKKVVSAVIVKNNHKQSHKTYTWRVPKKTIIPNQLYDVHTSIGYALIRTKAIRMQPALEANKYNKLKLREKALLSEIPMEVKKRG